MRIALEQAGAERALLILTRGGGQKIAADAMTSRETVLVHLRDEDVSETVLPETMLQYVLRTRESVILEDAAARSPFASDPYISRTQARSVLCLPLLNQSRLVGALYLENNLAPHVFAPGRVAVLKLLASQASTALENTRLYGDLAEREAKIRRLVDANIIGIFTWHIPRDGPERDEGFFLEVNDAFLHMLGYEREDFVSGRLRRSELTPPEWRDRDLRTVAELRTFGVSQPLEKEYLRKDGNRVPVLVGGACFDETGTHGVAFVLDLTERKRAENELRRNEARMEEAQRVAHVGWWERDFATNRVSLSAEACRIFGVQPVDLPDWHDRWLQLIHPEDRPRALEAAAAALRGGPRYDVEYRVVRRDGALRIVHSQGDVVWDDSGQPLRQFGVMQDITELRQVAQELRASEARFRTFVDYATDAFFLLDDNSMVVDVNRQACDGLGYSREELIGRHRRDFDTSLDETFAQGLKQRIAAAESVIFETRHRRKDGTTFPVEIRVGQFEQGGRRYLCLVRDITERKSAEEALRRSEAYFAEAQRLSHTGTAVYDATGTLLYWSEESYRNWGLDPLQGLPDRETAWQRIHPDDRDRVRALVLEALRQKREYVVEFRIVLPDGTVRHLVSTGHPLLAADGERVEIVATDVDVTERVRAQEQSEKLRQLEIDLAHMNRLSMMGELTASLAHEILHPIATARNNARAGMRFLDMIPPDLGEVRDALSCVVRDADRAKDIVGRVRDHIKKAPPRKDRFDLDDAISEVVVMVRSAISKNRVSVSASLMDGLIPVQGDRVQLQQVVVNLILNAVEAMSSVEEGARELLIRTEQNQTGGVLVEVRDSGPGIDREDLERAFEPFYTTKTSGVGMGLSICRSIIVAHGGRLWVDVNEPRGAVFRFTLPGLE